MIVTWFTPPRRSVEWFGQTQGTLATIARGGMSAVASVIGPPGEAGADGANAFRFIGDVAPDTTSWVTNDLWLDTSTETAND